MKVLVTGGNGFIGSATCRSLLRQGMQVAVLDPRAMEPGRGMVPGVEMRLGDTRDATAVTEAVAHVDGVIHLAGVLGTQETITNPLPAAETNILGGLNVLQACSQYDTPMVNIGVGNWFENNTYSLTKHAVERFGFMYARYRAARVCTVRALNAYGPGQSVAAPYGTSKVRKIMPSFIARALHDDVIEVYGDGRQVMDMIHVDDVADTLVAALLYLFDNGGTDHVFEVGTGRSTTVLDIAQCVRDVVVGLYGIRPSIEHLPMRPGETPGVEVRADVSTLEPLAPFGIDPINFTSLEEGTVGTVDHYASIFGVPKTS